MIDESAAVAAERRQLIRLRDRGIRAEKALSLIDKTLERERKKRSAAHQMVLWIEWASNDSAVAHARVRSLNALVSGHLAEVNDGTR